MAAVPSIGRAAEVEPRPLEPEADATQALYERYAGQIFGYCLHQLGSREEAEDAVQSTFLNAFRGLKRGVIPQLESAWLFKIAHNVCLSRRRSAWRRGRVETPGDLQAFQDVIAAPQRRGDDLMGLDEALSGMPEQQRRAILLREWQGLSYREIAAEMELSQAAVETLIFRARRSLAQGLAQPETKQRLRRLRHGLDVGSLLAGLKSALAGATAAKVAATVVVATTATVAATASPQETRRPAPAPAAKSSEPAVSSQLPLVAPAAAQGDTESRTGGARAAKERRLRPAPTAGAPLGDRPAMPEDPLEPPLPVATPAVAGGDPGVTQDGAPVTGLPGERKPAEGPDRGNGRGAQGGSPPQGGSGSPPSPAAKNEGPQPGKGAKGQGEGPKRQPSEQSRAQQAEQPKSSEGPKVKAEQSRGLQQAEPQKRGEEKAAKAETDSSKAEHENSGKDGKPPAPAPPSSSLQPPGGAKPPEAAFLHGSGGGSERSGKEGKERGR